MRVRVFADPYHCSALTASFQCLRCNLFQLVSKWPYYILPPSFFPVSLCSVSVCLSSLITQNLHRGRREIWLQEVLFWSLHIHCDARPAILQTLSFFHFILLSFRPSDLPWNKVLLCCSGWHQTPRHKCSFCFSFSSNEGHIPPYTQMPSF